VSQLSRTSVVPHPGSGVSVDEIARRACVESRIDLLGARGGALAVALARMQRLTGRQVLLVVADTAAAATMHADLCYHLGLDDEQEEVLLLPAPDQGPYDEVIPDRRTTMQRAGVLFRIAARTGWRVLVASADGLMRRTVSRARFEGGCVPVAVGDRLDRDHFLEVLEDGGYSRSPLVEEPGTYALRGGLVDFFPPYLSRPARIELINSDVERIRLFDPETQASEATVPEVWVHPARATVMTAKAADRMSAAERIRVICDAVDQPTSRTERLIEDLLAGRVFVGAEGFAPAFQPELTTVLDHLPDAVDVCVDDPIAVRLAWAKGFAACEEEHRRKLERGEPAFAPWDHLARPADLNDGLARRRLVISHRLAVEARETSPLERCVAPLDLRAEETSDLRDRLRMAAPEGDRGDVMGPLVDHLRALVEAGYRAVIVARTAGYASRLEAMLRGRGVDCPGETAREASAPGVYVATGELSDGCLLPGDAMCWIAEEEIFGHRARRRKGSRKTASGLSDLRNLVPGDLVVHEEHGVGRYEGLHRQRIRGAQVDFLHIVYRDGDKLLLPVYRLDQVQKYRLVGEGAARLDKLGGQTFAKVVAGARKNAMEMAARLLDLYARREIAQRAAVAPQDELYAAFEASFPFEETADQERAITDVMEDLESGRPMDRLVCGDVGFGKTEVAMRAAFRVVVSGRQVAVLVPTTVLAQQHYQSFSRRFAPYPVRVEMMSRFRTDAQNSQVALGLKEGSVDIVIGTHRLLSRDVHFKRLGLLVIDEEHRFGVAHKERIRALRASVDTMVLTATPIPRTLHMAFSRMRDLSLMATAPVDRMPIKTVICHDDPAMLRKAMERELARDGQVFYVHNRVRDIGRVAARVEEMMPGARVAVGHGQMKEEDLERVMLDFVAGRYDVLVCTAIIESGLDIPRANTIIIDRADTFGLAQLYQLRGRVGRSHVQAHAYLVVPPLAVLSDEARERVEALTRYTDLGSGFSVATLDLEIRGAGNLLGEQQSGDMVGVGFEMYCDLLAEAAALLRGEEPAAALEPEMTLENPGLLPEEYIPDMGLRLQYYKRLASARSERDAQDTAAELEDRFGPLPAEAETLLAGMTAKALCRILGIAGLEVGSKRIVVHLGSESRVDPERVALVVRAAEGAVRLTGDLKIVLNTGKTGGEGAAAAIRFLRSLGACEI